VNIRYFVCALPLSVIASAVAFALSSSAYGGTVPEDDIRDVDENARVEGWLLSAGSTLNVLPGASTLEITAVDGATLNITSGKVSTAFEGINLVGSSANLTDATVVSTGNYGLLVNRGGANDSGPSRAVVTGGSISGVGGGVYATFESEVGLSGVSVNGSGDGSVDPFTGGTGLILEGASGIVQNGSIITGSAHGVYLGADALSEDSGGNTSLSVQGSTIIGTASSAILVQSFEPDIPANANILIGAGSLVQGGNGVAIEVTDNAAATIRVDNSTLQGAIAVADTGTASATLSNGAKVNGDVTNVGDVTLSGASILTGNLTRTTHLLASGSSVINGDVSEVQSFILDSNSSFTGNLSNTAALVASDTSAVSGNVTNVQNFTLNDGSRLTGNLSGSDTLSVNGASRLDGNVSNVKNFNVTGNSFLNGDLANVANLSLDNSSWTTGGGSGVENLALNAGTVKLGAGDGTFETLNVSSLSGNGRFLMDTNLATHQSDLLSVSGVANGNYDLLVKNTGVEPVKGDQDQRLVHTGAGSTAGFGVVGGQVDAGTFVYELKQRGDDWYLVQKLEGGGGGGGEEGGGGGEEGGGEEGGGGGEEGGGGKPITTPSTRSVIGLFSAAPTVWYGELSSLRTRMGELRYGKAQGGGWMRSYGNKYNLSAAGGTAYQQNQSGISFGADAPLPTSDGQWLVGVLGGYSRSDLDLASGTNGQVDSYYIGGYTTWLTDQGWYVDAILKANRFKNKSDVRMSDGTKASGDYNNSGIGVSVEAGKHIKLQDDWFVEPFAQISTLWVEGESYSLDNGMQARSNKADSILGKVGTSVGRNFALQQGGFVQPYVKVAMAQEFARSNRVKVNTNTFSNDLSGSRGEIGAGIAAQLSDVLQLHADVGYSNGENIEQPWGVNVGLRYSW
jgi:outer membrane autotransporter protein